MILWDTTLVVYSYEGRPPTWYGVVLMYTTHITYRGILNAILEEPLDDFPRLALADWLEESGDYTRARAIRLDIERWRRWPDFTSVSQDERPSRYADHADLKQIEEELFKVWKYDSSFPLGLASIRRGFIGELRYTFKAWLDAGAGIIQNYPIEKLIITDWRPQHTGGRFCWFWGDQRGGHYRVPRDVWDLMPDDGLIFKDEHGWRDYGTEDAARIAIGIASLNAARQKVGWSLLKSYPSSLPCG